jgi:tRNA-2-methylthio-N6-dimethylallyladenosine synthase
MLSERVQSSASNEEMIIQKVYIEKVKEILESADFLPSCVVETYGCQQNASDSEKLKGMAEEMGFVITENKETADLIIFNTCAVRDSAEKKVLGNIGALKQLKRSKEKLLIGLCGCMMQQEHIANEIKMKYPYVDMVFGTHAIYKFPEILYNAITTKKRIFSIEDTNNPIAEGVPIKRESSLKANVTVMYGCNNFCSYCIVPYVRGRERSREPKEILREMKGLIADGYKDITLLGQNVNSYGKDLENKIDFSDLLRDIAVLDGDFRVRFMTSHPKDITHKLLDTIAEFEKISKHIHLPVQSGSNRVLALMNRGYTREKYMELIQYAKSKIESFTLTSDIIVGFPSETEEDFLDTVDLIKQVEFDVLFTFIYSKRKGTPAEQMEGQLAYEEKQKRLSRLIKEQNIISRKINETYLGKTVRVLVEGKSQNNENVLTGRTDGNKIVNFSGEKEDIGQFVNVEITDIRTWSLLGNIKKV